MPYEAMSAETVNIRGHEEDMIDAYMARPTGTWSSSGSRDYPPYARLG